MNKHRDDLQPSGLPGVPFAYRRASLFGGLGFLGIVSVVAWLAVPDLLSERVPYALSSFDLNWDPEVSELRLHGTLLEGDGPMDDVTHGQIQIVLEASLPARFYGEPHPHVFFVERWGRWDIEPLPAGLAPAVLAILTLFGVLGLQSVRYWAKPRLNLRRIRKAPRRVEGVMIKPAPDKISRNTAAVHSVLFQALIDGVVWRYSYDTQSIPMIRTPEGSRPAEPSDRFVFYCLEDDPQVFVLPTTLEPA